jgi:hypothetical protein
MQGKDALKLCPELILVRVPTKHGKADLTIYKKAGNAVVSILKQRADACEKRSVDEVAIDITSASDKLLASESLEEIVRRAKVSAIHPQLGDELVVAAPPNGHDELWLYLLRPGRTLPCLASCAQAESYLADEDASTAAAAVSKEDTRRGHTEQVIAGLADPSPDMAFDGTSWGQLRFSLLERRLVAGAVVVAELRAQVT